MTEPSAADVPTQSDDSQPASPLHVVHTPFNRASRREALRALHEGLARAEQNLHDLLPPGRDGSPEGHAGPMG